MPEFQVVVACSDHCEGWELPRTMFTTDDPIAAIDRSEMHRDQLHTSWVEKA